VSFLDDLENNLKALESRDEKDPEARAREAAAREAPRLVAQIAPRAEALDNGPFNADPLASTLVDGAPPDTGRTAGIRHILFAERKDTPCLVHRAQNTLHKHEMIERRRFDHRNPSGAA